MTEHEQKQDIEGKLDIAVKLFAMSAGGHGTLNLTEKEKQNVESLSCKFNGDVRIMDPPTTWMEAIQVYRVLPKMINKTTAIPVKVHLYPLAKLDNKGQRLVRQISVSLLQEVTKRMEDYENLQRGVGDLRLTESYDQLFYFQKQVEDFMSAVEVRKNTFSRGLALLLPTIRGQGREEAELADMLHNSEQVYSISRLKEWIRWRKMEAGALMGLIRLNPNVWLTKPGQFERAFFDERNKYLLVLNLGLYFENDVSTTCINGYCTEQEKMCSSWLKTLAKKKFLDKSKLLENFVKNNGWATPQRTLFIITENLNTTNRPDVELNYYAEQELVVQDLEKIPSIKSIHVQKETCSYIQVEWEMEMMTPYLKGFHVLWKNITTGAENVMPWNQLAITKSKAIIPIGGFDLELIIQPVLDFGNGPRNYSFLHATSVSNCLRNSCLKANLKAGRGVAISFSPSGQDPLGELGLALGSCTNPSFEFVGPKHSICLKDGWSLKSLGNCIPPKVSCKHSDLTTGSGVKLTFLTKGDPVPEGNGVIGSCPEGAMPVGQMFSTCSKSGWLPKKLGFCEKLSDLEGKKNDQINKRIDSMKTVVQKCRTYYTVCNEALNLHNIQCPTGLILTQFHMILCGREEKYQFTCCQVALG